MAEPRLSLILPLHASARQADVALTSLCSSYQEAPNAPFEVLVVEAASNDSLGETRARAHGECIRYLEIEDGPGRRSRSIELGVRESRSPFLGVFRDAAHWVTPRVVSLAMRALDLDDRPLVVLPEYRLDPAKMEGAGNADSELAWLARSRFREHPYDLFSKLRYGWSNLNGFLGPLFGGGCLFAPKHAFEALPTFAPKNDAPGGAAYGLWQYMELARVPGTRLIVLVGEGAVLVHHPELDAPNVRHEDQNQHNLLFAAKIPLGPSFHTLHREPVAFGAITGPLQRFVSDSANLAEFHCAMCRARGEASWYEDPRLG